MEFTKAIEILSARPNQSLVELAIEKPTDLPPPQIIELATGGVGRSEPAVSQSPQEIHRCAVQKRAAEMSDSTLAEVIHFFLKVQETRVSVYADYERQFQEMIATRNFALYSEACSRATALFGPLSADAAAAIEHMRTSPCALSARRIQVLCFVDLGCAQLCIILKSLSLKRLLSARNLH